MESTISQYCLRVTSIKLVMVIFSRYILIEVFNNMVPVEDYDIYYVVSLRNFSRLNELYS